MEIIRKNYWVDGKYTQQEQKAFEAFVKLSNYQKQFFNDISGTSYGCYYDVFSLNQTGGTEHIELKLRDEKAGTYKDCYIELEKWNSLIKDWREKSIAPLYINFIGSADNVYMWFLPNVQNVNTYIGVPVKSDDGKYEIVDRLGLAWDEAYHFTWNEEIQNYNMEEPKNKRKIYGKAKKYV